MAPLLDGTDRHCRFLHRLITRRTRLYSEMVTTGALLHGDRARHLDFSDEEHPVALQLGGSEPAELAACARLAERWGYDEVNLNCGCPSERVQRGAFGACLMAEPELVADGVKAMRDAVALPVTVKHRIGLDRDESYDFVRDFVGTVALRGGAEVFIVHARNAWLKGLSPKQNREVPPLRHEWVVRLKRDFPGLTLVLNGGVAGDDAIAGHLAQLDGVMLGRHPYHHPWAMARWDERFFGEAPSTLTPDAVEAAFVDYLERLPHLAPGTARLAASRHLMGLRDGQAGARRWRQAWSDTAWRDLPPAEVSRRAREAMLAAASTAGAASAARAARAATEPA